jgi:hypothetical protein
MKAFGMNERRMTRRTASAVIAGLLATMAWAGNASAQTCLDDVYTGNANCTANDFAVTGITVTEILDGGCEFAGDSFTFNGTFNVGTGQTTRYDVGFYVGADGNQALTGQCNVQIIPKALNDADGDSCGDYTGTALVIPVFNVTAKCTDSNGNGFIDVALCSAYDQNAGNNCANASEAVPGAPSKCTCAQVETSLPTPHCEDDITLCDPILDNNVCTTLTCNPRGSGLGDEFGCSQNNNTAPCEDGLFCNGADTCSGGTCSAHAGDPCIGGGICGDNCNEAADNCFDPAGTVCRASAGVCDTQETCTGSSASCPADAFVSSATVCRASAGVCDVAESCTGSAAACPADGFVSNATVCRGSAGVCDVAESCTGSAAACPADGFVSSATQCRASAGVCDVAESCTGSGAACPADGFASTATVCRGSAGVCDVAESCTGSAAACPADGFQSSATQCRASAGVCDTAESCTGSGASCPADGFVSSATVCRASAGVCALAENCTGSAAACPANSYVSSATVCRGSAGVCDTAENCSGDSPTCPGDLFLSSATVCRADAGDCDVAENCTGSAAACPANAFEPADTVCTDDGNVCTDNVCDGSGTCQHPNNTDPCNDGAYCSVNDTCSGGTCSGTARDCGDGVGCTVDSCNEGTDSCDHSANNSLCDDQDACTEDICDAVNDCINDLICVDVCRSPGYWSTHSGYEKGDRSINVGQLVLDAAGSIEVCGQTISKTVNPAAPWLEGLGLSSNLEALCMRTKGVRQRQLNRQLTAAALNCVMSNGKDCDDITGRYIDVSYSACNELCATGVQAPGGPSAGECVSQLDCFNNGGQIVDGQCAKGTCAEQPDLYCGKDYGACPSIDETPQDCVAFEDNCHDSALCKEPIGVCPKSTPASSPKACQEARFNECTIDSCD